MTHIVSRLSSNVIYATYTKTPNNINQVQKEIKINGKADVANKKTLITEKGAITRITDDELALLQQNPVFKKHLANGVVEIVKSENDAKKIVKDEILLKDFSAPLTASEMGNVKVSTSGASAEKEIDDLIKEKENKEVRNRGKSKEKENKE